MGAEKKDSDGGFWWRRVDSNLSRFAVVSEAGDRRRNPERSRGTSEDWWRRVDSNHGPTDYETVALAT